jgi:predicted acylesterase/phospholipase RssA
MLLSGYGKFLLGFKAFLSIARLIRFSIVISFLSSIAVLLPDQSLEALRVVAEYATAEDSEQTVRPLVLLTLAVLFLCLMLWYWARVLLYLNRPLSFKQSGVRGWAARNLPRIWGVLPLLSLSFALYRASDPRITQKGPAQNLLFQLFIIGLIAASLLYLAFHLRGRFIKRPAPLGAGGQLLVRQLSFTSKLVLSLTAPLWLGLLIEFYRSAGQSARWFGTVAIVFICCATWVPFGSILVHFGRRTRAPFLELLLLAAILFSAFDLNDNHMIRHQTGVRQSLPIEFNLAFTEWLKNRADLQEYETYPVFVVSAEGGGLRAAYFTALVLSSIQDRCPAFAQHTFVISGVSGGSLGATVFSALAARSAKNQVGLRCNLNSPQVGEMATKVDKILRQDFLSPLLAFGLYPDLAQRFLPFAIDSFDRARVLEEGLERAWKEETGGDEFKQSFYDLWKDFPREATPALFLNTTRVETGDRMVISNLYPLHERFNRLASLAEIDWSLTLPLSTAACLSARFPIVTPAGYLPRGADASGRPVERQRYVDGGYFENSGAATLFDVIAAMRAPDGMKKPSYELIVIRIGNSLRPKLEYRMAESNGGGHQSTITIERAERTQYRRQGLGEVLSPIRTLLNTREARGDTSINQLNTAISALLDDQIPARFIEFQLFEANVALPLGWLLSKSAREEMKRQLGQPRPCEMTVGIENPCSFEGVIDRLMRHKQ